MCFVREAWRDELELRHQPARVCGSSTGDIPGVLLLRYSLSCSSNGMSPAWAVALGSAPVPGAFGCSDSSSTPGAIHGMRCQGLTVWAPQPLGPLLQGTNVVTLCKLEDLRHS